MEQDFYKRVRESLKRLPREGGDLARIAAVPDGVSSVRRPHIVRVVQGFIGWTVAHEPEFFHPPVGQWECSDLVVPVRPEIGAIIDGVPHVLKVNYTATPTKRDDGAVIAHLLHTALGRTVSKKCRMGVLDLRTGDMSTTRMADPNLDAPLRACATEASQLWDELQREDV